MKKCLFFLCLLLCVTCFLCACDEAEPPETDPETSTHTHEWGEWRISILATCTTEGQEKRLCACGEVEKRVVPVTQEHNFTEKCMTAEYEYTSSVVQTVGVYCYKCSVCDAKGTNIYVTEEASICFGEYPQTLKAENVEVTETTDSRGYFLGSDGAYYAKVTATPYRNDYTFSSGIPVVGGEVYYFKVEPIRWRVISKEGNTVKMMCDSVIDKTVFDTDKAIDNYADSDIRAWLNDQFYNTAFGAAQQEMIATTSITVDDEETMEDKVFLFTRDEVRSAEYFATNDDRLLISSDYIRAIGARVDAGTGMGIWWNRTFRRDEENDANIPGYAFLVYTGGETNYYHDVDMTCYGVAPVLTIDFS